MDSSVFLFIELFIEHVKRKEFFVRNKLCLTMDGSIHKMQRTNNLEPKMTRDMREVCLFTLSI